MEIDKEEIQEIISQKIKDGEKRFGKDFKFLVMEIVLLEKMIGSETAAEDAQSPKEETQARLIPLVKWNEFHPDPTVSALRMLVFRGDKNGFNNVIEKRGHRILINEDKYFEWCKARS